jgi:FlaA1/EpsC-like NDP-sugar epimerase
MQLSVPPLEKEKSCVPLYEAKPMPETHTPPWSDSHRFWRNKRVLVTGGHGFLGRHVVRQLKVRGAGHVLVADYVEDAAEGILLAAERYNQSAPVNL